MNNANIILDLRIFENNRYFRDILDTEVAKYLRHNQTVDQTVENIETGWNKLTDEIGRNKQLKAYRASLGLVATPWAPSICFYWATFTARSLFITSGINLPASVYT